MITLEKTTEKRGERGHDKLPVIDGDPRQNGEGEGGREEGPKDGENNQKREVSIRRANLLYPSPVCFSSVQQLSGQFAAAAVDVTANDERRGKEDDDVEERADQKLCC